jgi:NAD(P)-dependent dehydrogenase (short-subunit alcohol dehydrogenase family)
MISEKEPEHYCAHLLIPIRHPTVELSLADWNNVVAVNMTGVFLGSRAAARYMLPKRKGSIVNTASIMGLSGGGLYPNVCYQATKGGIVNMTRGACGRVGSLGNSR